MPKRCTCALALHPLSILVTHGIDTSVRKELIAATHTVDEIKDYIHADKLHYLSREGLCRACI